MARGGGTDRPRHFTAVGDLPDRRASLRAERAAIAAIAVELARDAGEAERLPLPADLVEALRGAMEGLSGIEMRLREARCEHERSRTRLAAARDALARAGEAIGARKALVAALGAVGGGDVDARVRIAGRDRANKAEALRRRLGALGGWRGDAEALAAMRMPDGATRRRLGETQAAARLEDEVFRLGARRDALSHGSTLVDDAAAASSRAAREAAWSVHAAALDAGTADAFERALRVDDEAGARRLSQADAFGQLRAADLALASAAAELSIAGNRAAAARRLFGQSAAALAASLDAAPEDGGGWTPAALDDFADRRESALEARDELGLAERDLADAREDAERVRRTLDGALAECGRPATAGIGVAALAAQVRAILEEDGRRRDQEERVRALERECGERARQEEGAGDGRAAWDGAWRGLLERTWLPPPRPPSRGCVTCWRGWRSSGRRSRGGTRWPTASRRWRPTSGRSRTWWRRWPSRWASKPVATGSPRRCGRSTRGSRRRGPGRAGRLAKSRDLEAARGRLAALLPVLAAVRARGDEMTARFGVAGLADVAVALDVSARRDGFAARAGAIGLEIVAACSTRSLDEAEALLSGLDPEALGERGVELAALREDQDMRTQELFAALGRAQEALDAVDGDDAAARLEQERRTVLLEIEEGTLSHLAMRAGIVSAEVALRLFRERHRSSMMASASAVFRDLTRGAYDGLVTQAAGGGEVLAGLVAEGGSRLSREMSTATRNQLYLALRIAGHAEYAKTRRPPPLVLDDVLETFDDERAEAALVQLAATAGTGQVIYLTHHRHLCEIARRTCPGASVSELPPR